MRVSIKNNCSYTSVIVKLAVCTTLSVIGCILLGYLFLPFAAGSYAALLLYENKAKRILSYAIPAVMFATNLLLNGIYSLEALVYVVVGLIIYLAFTRGVSKGETVFCLSFLVTVFIVLSAILFPFDNLGGSIGVISIKQFYSNLYNDYRTFFVELVTSLTQADENGIWFFAFNDYEAEKMFTELVMAIIPLLAVTAFLISGVSVKLFFHAVLRYSEDKNDLRAWEFRTSNLIAYFYVAIAILYILNDFNGSVFDFTLTSLNTIFAAVFAYIGVKSVYRFFTSRGRGPMFTVIIIVVISMLLASNIVSLLSYLGVIVNVKMNGKKHEAK